MHKPTLLLFRDLPRPRSASMERFADALALGLRSRNEFLVRDTTIGPLWRGRASKLDWRLTLLVRYPLFASRQTADIYHIVDHAYAHLALFLPRERTIATCHDLMLLRADEGVAGFRGTRHGVKRFRWSTSFLRSLALVVCDSEATRQDVLRLCGVAPSRAIVVPLGVDQQFRPLPAEQRGSFRQVWGSTRTKLLLHVSTGAPYKNVEATLHVLSRLRLGGIDVTLLRAGAPLTALQNKLSEDLGVAAHIRDLGRVGEETLIRLYGVCDAFVFPSHHEGFGLPVLEAMACGAPTVTSTCPALIELAGGASASAAAQDIDALSHAVARVLEDDTLSARLRQAGLARAARYTWDRTAEMYARAYERLLS